MGKIKLEDILDAKTREFIEGFPAYKKRKFDETKTSLQEKIKELTEERDWCEREYDSMAASMAELENKAIELLIDCAYNVEGRHLVTGIYSFDRPDGRYEVKNFCDSAVGGIIDGSDFRHFANGKRYFPYPHFCTLDFEEALHGVPLENSNYFKRLTKYKNMVVKKIAEMKSELKYTENQLKNTFWPRQKQDLESEISDLSAKIRDEESDIPYLDSVIEAYCDFYKNIASLDQKDLDAVAKAIENNRGNNDLRELSERIDSISNEIDDLNKQVKNLDYNFNPTYSDYIRDERFTPEDLKHVEQVLRDVERQKRESAPVKVEDISDAKTREFIEGFVAYKKRKFDETKTSLQEKIKEVTEERDKYELQYASIRDSMRELKNKAIDLLTDCANKVKDKDLVADIGIYKSHPKPPRLCSIPLETMAKYSYFHSFARGFRSLKPDYFGSDYLFEDALRGVLPENSYDYQGLKRINREKDWVVDKIGKMKSNLQDIKKQLRHTIRPSKRKSLESKISDLLAKIKEEEAYLPFIDKIIGANCEFYRNVASLDRKDLDVITQAIKNVDEKVSAQFLPRIEWRNNQIQSLNRQIEDLEDNFNPTYSDYIRDEGLKLEDLEHIKQVLKDVERQKHESAPIEKQKSESAPVEINVNNVCSSIKKGTENIR